MPIIINENIPIFYINLDDNITRKNSIENTIKNLNFKNYTRIPAINTKSFQNIIEFKDVICEKALNTLIDNNRKKFRNNHYELTNGSIGCYLSHLKIYKEIINKNIPYALIFEDDCKVNNTSQNFWENINKMIIPADADIFLLNCSTYDKGEYFYENIKKHNFFIRLHCYIITLEGAKKALPKLLPITMQIDSKLSRLAFNKILNIYVYTKNIGITTPFITTMQNLDCEKCNIYKEIHNFSNGDIEHFTDGNVKHLCKLHNDDIFNKYELFIFIILFMLGMLLFYKKKC